MPTPNSNETREDFISRCMSDDEAVATFPDEDQRMAFCSSQWDESRKSADRLGKEKRKAITDTRVKALSEDRKVRVIASTETEDRAGDVVRANGIDLGRYKTNPVVLFNHDSNHPIARCTEIGVSNGRLEAVVQFPEEGTSQKSDEIYRLVKAGVINAVSIGFMGGECEMYGDYGLDFKSSELLEFSFVSVPANPDALVIERALRDEPGLLTGVEQIELLKRNLDAVRKGADAIEKAISFSDALSKTEYQEEIWELYRALWETWDSIDADEDMSDEEKQSARLQAFNEYAGAVRELLSGGEYDDDDEMEEEGVKPTEPMKSAVAAGVSFSKNGHAMITFIDADGIVQCHPGTPKAVRELTKRNIKHVGVDKWRRGQLEKLLGDSIDNFTLHEMGFGYKDITTNLSDIKSVFQTNQKDLNLQYDPAGNCKFAEQDWVDESIALAAVAKSRMNEGARDVADTKKYAARLKLLKLRGV